MPTTKEIYDKLIEDPNLEVGSNQTREEAALTEATYRVRQYYNNEKALSLANEPLEEESPVLALKTFVSKMHEVGKSLVDGAVAIAQDVYKNQLNFFDETDDGVRFVHELNNPQESNAYKALPKTHPLKSYIDSSLNVWKSDNEDGNIDIEHLRGLNTMLAKEHEYALNTGAKFISKTQTEHMFKRINENHKQYKSLSPNVHAEVLEKTKGLSKYLSKEPKSSKKTNNQEGKQGTLDNAKLFTDNEHLIRHSYEKKHSLEPGEELENLKYNEFKENFIAEHSSKDEKEIRHKVLSPLEASHRVQQKKIKDNEAKEEAAKQKVIDDEKKAEEAAKKKTEQASKKREDQREKAKQAEKVKTANTLPHSTADFKEVDKDVAHHMARRLLAHHSNHKEHMSEPKKKSLEGLLGKAKEMGADLDALAKERESMGANFGSKQHMEEAEAKHKENEDFKFTAHSDTPEALEARTLHANQKKANEYQHGFKFGKATKVTRMKHRNNFGQFEVGGFHESKSEEFDSGVGPPNPAIVPEMEAKGYVWHEDTRHWILKDTLNDMKKGVSGGSMSLAHKDHTNGGKASFLNANGGEARHHFVTSHAGLHGVDKNDITGASLHRNLNQGKHFDGLAANKIKDINHDDGTNILHNTGISHQDNTPPSATFKDRFKAGVKRGESNYEAYRAPGGSWRNLFKEKFSQNTALGLLLKKYPNHTHRATLHATELLEDKEEEKKENTLV